MESEQNAGINDSISCPFRHGRDDVDGGGGGGAHRDDSNYEYVIWIGAGDSAATLESPSLSLIAQLNDCYNYPSRRTDGQVSLFTIILCSE